MENNTEEDSFDTPHYVLYIVKKCKFADFPVSRLYELF